MQNDVSQAVVLYLGFRRAPSPREDGAKLVQEFGATKGAELESQVRSLVEELGKINVDWSRYSWESATKMARDRMEANHPDLSDDALEALAWKIAFDWR